MSLPGKKLRHIRSLAPSVVVADDPALALRGLSLAQTYEGLPEHALGIAWSADGEFLAAASGYDRIDHTGTGEVALWAAATGQRWVINDTAEPANVLGLAWHPVRPILAFGKAGGHVQLVNVDSMKSVSSFSLSKGSNGESKQVRGLAWSPDGSMLAVTDRLDEGGGIGVWDFPSVTLRREARNQSYYNAPCWSPDGRMILVPDGDGLVKVHASDDLRLLWKLHGHRDRAYFVDVSPDGELAASSSYDLTVRVWGLAKGRELVTLEELNESAGCVQFSPNGHLLASMTDSQVHLWRCSDWERVSTIPMGDTKRIGGVAFHPSLPLLAVKDNESTPDLLLQHRLRPAERR